MAVHQPVDSTPEYNAAVWRVINDTPFVSFIYIAPWWTLTLLDLYDEK
jgi:hypothetical protein